MEITKKEFNQMVADLGERNWKVALLLKKSKYFGNLSPHHKQLVLNELGVEIKVTTQYFVHSK